MLKTALSEAELLSGLQSGGSAEQRALEYLYAQNWPLVRNWVTSQQGSQADAEDIFQEGMIVLFEQVKAKKYRGESRLGGYLFSICRFLWLNRLKRERRGTEILEAIASELRENPPIADTPLKVLLETEKESRVMNLLEKLGEKCRELLRMSLYLGYSMKEISVSLGYKNAQIAKNKHYKCKKSLRDLLRKQPAIRKFINELR